jgi:hypothetical protein
MKWPPKGPIKSMSLKKLEPGETIDDEDCVIPLGDGTVHLVLPMSVETQAKLKLLLTHYRKSNPDITEEDVLGMACEEYIRDAERKLEERLRCNWTDPPRGKPH